MPRKYTLKLVRAELSKDDTGVAIKDVPVVALMAVGVLLIVLGVGRLDSNLIGIGAPLAGGALSLTRRDGWGTYGVVILGFVIAAIGASISWNDPTYRYTPIWIGIGTLVSLLVEGCVTLVKQKRAAKRAG
jgi:hypothetical protein